MLKLQDSAVIDETSLRGIFRTWSESMVEVFCENSEWLIAVKYIRQKAPL